MAALLTFAAWIFDLFLGFLSAATAGWFFLLSPTFRRQAYARWSRQSQAKTLEEISEGAFGVAATLALAALIPAILIAVARTL